MNCSKYTWVFIVLGIVFLLQDYGTFVLTADHITITLLVMGIMEVLGCLGTEKKLSRRKR